MHRERHPLSVGKEIRVHVLCKEPAKRDVNHVFRGLQLTVR